MLRERVNSSWLVLPHDIAERCRSLVQTGGAEQITAVPEARPAAAYKRGVERSDS